MFSEVVSHKEPFKESQEQEHSWLQLVGKDYGVEGDFGMAGVTRAHWSQLLHISFLGSLFMGNTCSDPKLKTHDLTQGLNVGKRM